VGESVIETIYRTRRSQPGEKGNIRKKHGEAEKSRGTTKEAAADRGMAGKMVLSI
jgi:hypothetical protein